MADVTDANSKDGELCGQCHRSGVLALRSMAKWSPFDWFRCVGCGHIFTRPRPSETDDADDAAARRDRRLTVRPGR